MTAPYFRRIAAAELTGGHVRRGSAAAVRLRDELQARGEPLQEIGMFSLFREFSGELPPESIAALWCRMRAVSRLIDAGHLKDWSLLGHPEPDATFVTDSVFDAIATAPLDVSSGDPVFDPDDFRRVALAFSEPEGRA